MPNATCYRHPDRETGVSCSRCGRPICPDCMTPTSVGMRCPECSNDKTTVRTAASVGPGSGPARATKVLIGINVVAFLLEVFSGSGGFNTFGSTVFGDGALCGNAIGDGGRCFGNGIGLITDGGEWWRVITAGFLHAGIFHIALNMFALYVLGQVLEPAIGTARFVALYLVSLVAGSVGALLLSDPNTFTIGASGAIYGLFVATIIVARHRGFGQVVQQLGFWLVLNLVFTFSVSGISIGGHLGGMVGGAVAALLVIGAERGIAGRKSVPAELGVLAALGVACFVAAVVVATTGVGF
ncbi:MAG: rhomboid family intramembrane serine protease [Solirubrobacterales bacterium]